MLSMTENIADAADESSFMVESSYPSKTESARDEGSEFKLASSDVATLSIMDTVFAADVRKLGLTVSTVYISWTADVNAKLKNE